MSLQVDRERSSGVSLMETGRSKTIVMETYLRLAAINGGVLAALFVTWALLLFLVG